MLRIFIHGDTVQLAVQVCRCLVTDLVHKEAAAPDEPDLAIATLLERKLAREEYEAPHLCMHIFHLSLLSIYRGYAAIKQAYRTSDQYRGVTWSWCAERLDAISIGELPVLLMDRALRPREFYERIVLRASAATLRWALEDLSRDHVRGESKTAYIETAVIFLERY